MVHCKKVPVHGFRLKDDGDTFGPLSLFAEDQHIFEVFHLPEVRYLKYLFKHHLILLQDWDENRMHIVNHLILRAEVSIVTKVHLLD